MSDSRKLVVLAVYLSDEGDVKGLTASLKERMFDLTVASAKPIGITGWRFV